MYLKIGLKMFYTHLFLYVLLMLSLNCCYFFITGFASANGALLVLQDEDTTNDISGEWKKLNTLEHYKVNNNFSFSANYYYYFFL